MAGQNGNGSREPCPPSPEEYERGKRRRLLTVTSIKHELADIVRNLRDGSEEPKRANALVFALSKLADIIQASDFEQRLMRIERRVTGSAPETPPEATRQ